MDMYLKSCNNLFKGRLFEQKDLTVDISDQSHLSFIRANLHNFYSTEKEKKPMNLYKEKYLNRTFNIFKMKLTILCMYHKNERKKFIFLKICKNLLKSKNVIQMTKIG